MVYFTHISCKNQNGKNLHSFLWKLRTYIHGPTDLFTALKDRR